MAQGTKARILMDRLREVFPAEPLPANLVSDLAREAASVGVERIECGLQRRAWTSLSEDLVNSTAPHLIVLTLEAFVYYLPAYLQAVLEDMDGEAGTYVLYALVPLGGLETFYSGTCEAFSPSQAAVIADVLEAMSVEASFFYFSEEIPVGLELWRRRSEG